VENVVNDGSTTLDDQLGAVVDLQLAIKSRKLKDDIMVVWGIFLLLMDLITFDHSHCCMLYNQHFFIVSADCRRHAVCRSELWHSSGYSILQVEGEILQTTLLCVVWLVEVFQLKWVCFRTNYRLSEPPSAFGSCATATERRLSSIFIVVLWFCFKFVQCKQWRK